MKTYIITDLHGNYRGLRQCLQKVNFDYEEDRLITLGDYVDGYSQSYEVIEELLKIQNLIPLLGNHDLVFRNYLQRGIHELHWEHGADKTAESYARFADREIKIQNTFRGWDINLTSFDVPDVHKEFFNKLLPYYLEDNNLFVHGGINRHIPITEQSLSVLVWDRDFFSSACTYHDTNREYKNDFKKVFLGHSPTVIWETNKPMFMCNVINLDTGGGYANGKVTIMDLESMEYWQSDLNSKMYPNEKGR